MPGRGRVDWQAGGASPSSPSSWEKVGWKPAVLSTVTIRKLERDGSKVVVGEGVESSEEAPLQHCSRPLGRAKPSAPDAGQP